MPPPRQGGGQGLRRTPKSRRAPHKVRAVLHQVRKASQGGLGVADKCFAAYRIHKRETPERQNLSGAGGGRLRFENLMAYSRLA